MSHWYRHTPFSADHGRDWNERWEYRKPGADIRSFDVKVRAGKSLDVLKLKGISIDEVREYSQFLQTTATRLYGGGADIQQVQDCPLCHASLTDARIELTVFRVPYVRCSQCGHVGVGARPRPAVLDEVFAESDTHSSTYVDHNAIEIRMAQIIAPKLEWCAGHFRDRNHRAPGSVIDVGAGGGHFLAGAQRGGMQVEGYEKSRSSRAFAKDAFGLDLHDADFLATQGSPAELITFWGLLEYVAQPREFIAAARRRITPDGMLVVEVPRVDSLGTQVQAMPDAVVARHMDPTTHVNGFTDESLCTALVDEGFIPVAAWYFGMDAYEACVQAALRANDPRLFDVLADFIPVIQLALDRGRQSDDIIIAAVPAP